MSDRVGDKSRNAAGASDGATTVGESTAGLVVIWAGFPIAGGLAGWLLLFTADWTLRLPFLPLPGWLIPLTEYVSRGPYPVLVAVGLGVVAGLVLSMSSTAELLTVEVDDDGVSLTRDSTVHHFPAESIACAFLDGNHLVILGKSREELVYEPCDLDSDRLEAAFRAHGFTWLESDPFEDAYRRWVPELPELSAEADAFLKARQQTIDDDDQEGARELRSELAGLGIVVRDVDTKQHFRLIVPPQRPPDQHAVRSHEESG